MNKIKLYSLTVIIFLAIIILSAVLQSTLDLMHIKFLNFVALALGFFASKTFYTKYKEGFTKN